ncbi:MAG: hypothetical protein R6T91_05395 [Bacteroidales bacterium]
MNLSIAGKYKPLLNFSPAPHDNIIIIKNNENGKIYTGIPPVIIDLKSCQGIVNQREFSIYMMINYKIIHMIDVRCNDYEWQIGNIAFGGLIKWIIFDPNSKSVWKLEKVYDSNSLKSKLLHTNKKLCILTREQVPNALKDMLVKIK